MAWKLEGTYFENCSCDMPCPCFASFDAGADYDRCEVILLFHVNEGEIDGTDVSGLTVAVVADAPKVMTDGNWRVALVIDDAASDEQAQKLGAVFGGDLGGPMEAVVPLIGEMIGVDRAPIDYGGENGTHSVTIGDATRVTVEDVVPFGSPTGAPVQYTNVFHPAASTVTISKASESEVDVLGLRFSNPGKAGASAPFSWSG